MSDKDEIKELFQKELGNYEAKVDPNLWNGIQSGLTGTAAAGGSAAGMSVLAKAVITVAVATVATLSAVMIFTDEKPVSEKEERIVKTESKKETEEVETKDKVDSEIKEEIKDPITEYKEDKTSQESEKNPSAEIVEIEQIETPDVKPTDVISESKENTPPTLIDSIESEEKLENNSKENTEVKELSAEISIVEKDNQYVKFGAQVENAEEIHWSFGDGKTSTDFSPEHFYKDPGTYNVVATIYGDENSIQKQLKIDITVEGKFTKLPNVFSPNNDGSNDEFLVEHEGIEEFQLNVFNQKQELVYTTNNIDFRWRGTDLKGNTVPVGNYIYIIMAKDKAGNVINKYEKLEITR